MLVFCCVALINIVLERILRGHTVSILNFIVTVKSCNEETVERLIVAAFSLYKKHRKNGIFKLRDWSSGEPLPWRFVFESLKEFLKLIF